MEKITKIRVLREIYKECDGLVADRDNYKVLGMLRLEFEELLFSDAEFVKPAYYDKIIRLIDVVKALS